MSKRLSPAQALPSPLGVINPNPPVISPCALRAASAARATRGRLFVRCRPRPRNNRHAIVVLLQFPFGYSWFS
jgi:hypothetical protein